MIYVMLMWRKLRHQKLKHRTNKQRRRSVSNILELALTPKGKKFKTHLDDRRTEYSKMLWNNEDVLHVVKRSSEKTLPQI